MIVRGPRVPTALTTDLYNRRCEGRNDGLTWKEWSRLTTACPKCGKKLKNASLKKHMQNIHHERVGNTACNEVATTATFRMGTKEGGKFKCPVPGCGGSSTGKWAMYRHFAWRHSAATIIFDDDGLLPRCPQCAMFVKSPTSHPNTKTFTQVQAQRKHEKLQVAQQEADAVYFTVNGIKIGRVQEYKYLGQMLTENDINTKCIKSQICQAQARWICVAKILKREGANARTMARFYLAVVQAVLLYGADSWTISETDMRKLDRFHKRAIRHMTGNHIQKNREGEWSYPDHDVLFQKCRLLPIARYIERRRGTLRNYLETTKPDLFWTVQGLSPPARGAKKVLWWRQPWLTKTEMDDLNSQWDGLTTDGPRPA